MKANNHVHLVTLTGILTALTTVSTIVIQIPTPTKGYVNLGDTIVNISSWILGGLYGGIAGGIGSALADIITGYAIYAPATFIIKFLMGFVCFKTFNICKNRFNSLTSRIISAIVSEMIMITGYDIFTGLMYNSIHSAIFATPEFLIQGIMGASFSVIIYESILKRVPALKHK